jgi:Fe(3+) dicitrate transport protein
MMGLRDFIILSLLVYSTTSFAQFNVTGIVLSEEDSSYIKECLVYLNDDRRMATTDNKGRFIFEDVPTGKHVLHFTNPDYKYQTTEVVVTNSDQFIRMYLLGNTETLQEVVISDQQTNFGFTRMRAVENFGIYEGKKSEVIIPDQMTANLATNNARQVYSRVAGLNIWENDGAGLQLAIGGRGLDPNRTSNFNVRQNGYDISADALGYPESYYTPPVEGVGKIQIVRGAASLQYGTQFGGLINFIMKKPPADKKFELTTRQTAGSFGFYNAFTSAGGTSNKLSYYTFAQYKRGDGWRKNSEFENYTLYANVNYQISTSTKLGIDVTHMDYLAQQPGGLTDDMFKQEPRQTNRSRNWFKVNWNLFAIHVEQKLNARSDINFRIFGLSASRYSVGFRPNRVATVDDNNERDLIKGDFQNWGAEGRYLNRYALGKIQSVLLVGGRYYHGFNHSTQGLGSTGSRADFNYVNPEQYITYNYQFPNRNTAAFLENIFYINNKLSITPGIRFEYINTTARGYYGTIAKDLAGNIIDISRTEENRRNKRHFVLVGLGISYKPGTFVDLYSNVSQNYRSITFSDMRISNPSSVIDQNLEDEKGYSLDLGVRSDQTTLFNYDVSLFYLNYDNRIGEVQFYDQSNRVLRRRGNIGQAIIQGLEAYGEADFLGLLSSKQQRWSGILFSNVALLHSRYTKSEIVGVEGNEVEFVPVVNLKSGTRIGYKNIKTSLQFTFLSDQYSDATNTTDGGVSAVVGMIPAYSVLDLSSSYTYKKFRLEITVNNLANHMYFTRRATGYPGPGILPSDGRSFFVTLQVKI